MDIDKQQWPECNRVIKSIEIEMHYCLYVASKLKARYIKPITKLAPISSSHPHEMKVTAQLRFNTFVYKELVFVAWLQLGVRDLFRVKFICLLRYNIII